MSQKRGDIKMKQCRERCGENKTESGGSRDEERDRGKSVKKQCGNIKYVYSISLIFQAEKVKKESC